MGLVKGLGMLDWTPVFMLTLAFENHICIGVIKSAQILIATLESIYRDV